MPDENIRAALLNLDETLQDPKTRTVEPPEILSWKTAALSCCATGSRAKLCPIFRRFANRSRKIRAGSRARPKAGTSPSQFRAPPREAATGQPAGLLPRARTPARAPRRQA